MRDNNLKSFYRNDSNSWYGVPELGKPVNPPDWDDSLKVTDGCHDFTAEIPLLYGGREDCVDINNRARNIGVNATFIPQGKFMATIKGGVENVTLNGEVKGHGTEVDIDLGNWSDQSSVKVTGVSLNLRPKFFETPITIRVLNSTKPLLVPGSGPYKYVWPLPWKWYHGIVVKAMLILGKVGLLKYL